MSVKFQVIALKFELSHTEDQIKEFITENDKFIYKANLHKKDGEHNIVFQKKKFQKIDPVTTFTISMESNNKTCILVLDKGNPDFTVHKMQQRGGEGKGRPKKGSEKKVTKACSACSEKCVHIEGE